MLLGVKPEKCNFLYCILYASHHKEQKSNLYWKGCFSVLRNIPELLSRWVQQRMVFYICLCILPFLNMAEVKINQ